MSIEVFVFGANNGAFSFPDKDASYFETTFYTDIKELPKNTPLFDVRLRQIGDQRWVDYTVLIYGLKGSRANDYIGVTCRSSQAFKRLGQIYDIMQNGISSFIVNALVNEDFEALMGEARKGAEEVRSRFIKLIETHVDLKSLTSFDLISIPSRAKGANSRLMQINPSDINQYKNYLDMVVDGCMLLISGEFPTKKFTADLNHLYTQINQTKSEFQSKLDTQEQKYQEDIESERTKLEQDYQDNLNKQKQEYEAKLNKLTKLNDELREKNSQLAKSCGVAQGKKSRCTSTDDFIDKEQGVDKGLFRRITQRISALYRKCHSSAFGRIILLSFITVTIILFFVLISSTLLRLTLREESQLPNYVIDISELSSKDQPLKPNKEYTFSIRSIANNKGDSIMTYEWIFPNEANKSRNTGMSVKKTFTGSEKEVVIKCEVTTSGDQSGTVTRKVSIE